MEKNPKEYRIDSFKTLLNVISVENIDVMAIDVMQWLYQYVKIIEKVRAEHPNLSKKTNYQICNGYFIWVDDGHNDILKTEIFNSDTGEKTTIEPNEKK